MKIEEFIKEYNVSVNKEECVKKHIIDKYVPYEEKIGLCKNVIRRANYIDNKFIANSPIQYMFFTLMLLGQYTDLEFIPDENIYIFNFLDKNDLVDMLYSLIPENEFIKMKTILKMVSDDIFENERSLVSYIDTKIDAITIALETIERTMIANEKK